MELKDALTLVGLAVSIGGLIVSLVKLTQEQRKANELKEAENNALAKSEKRSEFKLRIFQILIDDVLTFDELVAKFREQTPLTEVNPSDLRKCIYEMLVEGTLVAHEDKTYTANTIEESDDDTDEGGADYSSAVLHVPASRRNPILHPKTSQG